MPIYASTAILIVMSYDRYVHLEKETPKCKFKIHKELVKISLIWTLAITIASPQLFIFKIGKTRFVDNRLVSTCLADWPNKESEIAYIFYHVIVQYFFPIILLIFIFVKIYIRVSMSPDKKEKLVQLKNLTKESKKLLFKTKINQQEESPNLSKITLRRYLSSSRFNLFV